MTEVTIHEAKTHLSRLIRSALAGEDVIIAKGNQPLIRLLPLSEALPKRRLGGAKDVVKYMADDFDEPIDDFDSIWSSFIVQAQCEQLVVLTRDKAFLDYDVNTLW